MNRLQDHAFAFDVQGFLHLRSVLSPEEVSKYLGWAEEAARISPQDLNDDGPERVQDQLNRPLSRVVDADARFAIFLDHPAVAPFLEMFLGESYRHIDNDLYFTSPGYPGGPWHRGVRAHPTGHVVGGEFICPMVKVFYCLTDVGPGQGEFVVVPGSHRAAFEVPLDRIDLPAQHVFDDVQAGDVIVFNEALLHNGRPNPSEKTRKTIIVNFGREDAGPWPGYAPKERTLEAVTDRQRAILAGGSPVWEEPRFG